MFTFMNYEQNKRKNLNIDIVRRRALNEGTHIVLMCNNEGSEQRGAERPRKVKK